METWGEIDAAVAAAAGGFDPSRLTVSDALGLLPVIVRMKNTLAAVEAGLAGRVAESDRWRVSGARSAAEDYARRTGTGIGAARAALAAAAAMRECERLRVAALTGRVSAAQAAVIGETAETAPGALDGLLDLVESARGGAGGTGGSLPELRAAAQRAQAAADPDPEATRRRIHARRSVSTRRDGDGCAVLTWRDNPERIDLAHAGLAELHNQLFTRARRDGRRERPDALDADALYLTLTGQTPDAADSDVDLASRPGGEAPTPARSGARRGGVFRDAKILIRVDATTLQRGRPEPGEICESAGSGPIPVSAVRDLAARGGTVALVGTDCADRVVTVAHVPRARSATADLADPERLRELLERYGAPVAGVVHTGRAPTAAQVTALQWISPTCTVDGCTALRTQIDHTTGWALTHDTVLEDLDPLCPFHHQLKTRLGWRLDPGTGKRPFRPPDEPGPSP